MEAVEGALAPRKRDIAGKRVLITAGPTREAIDPVRRLSNRSTENCARRIVISW